MKGYKFVLVIVSLLPLKCVLESCVAPEIRHDFGNFDNLLFNISLADGKENVSDDDDEENLSLVVSPFYLKGFLLLISLGSEGATLNEINNALNIKGHIKKEVANKMNYNVFNAGTKMDAFGMFFLDENVQLKKPFKNIFKKTNYVSAHRLKFDSKARDKINNLIKKQSKTFINNPIIDEDINNAKGNVAFFSNIYFKSEWLYPPTVLNGSVNFYAGDDVIKTRMFRTNGMMRYAQINEIDAQVVEVPYQNCDLSLLVFVPNKIEGLDEMEEKLLKHINIIDYANGYLKSKPVAVTLPNFSLESMLLLPHKLMKFGISKLFSKGANLSHIMEDAYIAVANQRIIVWITAGLGAFKDTGDPEYPIPEKFVFADRPFFFIIKSNNNNLLMGHFYK